MRLKRIELENYKCFQKKSFDFAFRTEVNGRNRVGKTTLMDAYFDCITGKVSNGSEPTVIRPHDADGNLLRKVDVVRTVVLDIDGKEHTIKKTDSEKWVRPRGSIEEVFKGNATSYEVDEIPMKTRQEFLAWLSEKVAPMDDILLCSNPQFFLGKLAKSSADARSMLEKISGFDAASHNAPEFKEALEIMGDMNAETALKLFKGKLAKAKTEQQKKNTEIAYETGRELQTDFSEEESLVEELNGQAEEIKAQIKVLEADRDKCFEVRKEREKIENELSAYDSKIRSANAEKKSLALDTLRNAERERDKLYDKISQVRRDVEFKEQECENLRTKLAKLGDEWKETSARTFDEREKNCPYCGQELPEEKQKEMIEKFEKTKAGELSAIEKAGNRLKQDYMNATAEIARLKSNADHMEEGLVSLTDKVVLYQSNYDKLKTEAYNPELDENRKGIVARLEEAEKAVDNLENGNADELKFLRENLYGLNRKIAGANAAIAAGQCALIDKERRIKELNEELLSICDAAAKIERDIACIMQFALAKNELIEKMVNSHFHHFKFKFLEYTQEGNPVEVCKLVVDGTDYNGLLNGGDRRLVEVDLCRGFQEMKGLELPIWLDEAGTVDAWRLPNDMPQQLICLRYEEHTGIRVDDMEGAMENA